jgi:hypothetical protein
MKTLDYNFPIKLIFLSYVKIIKGIIIFATKRTGRTNKKRFNL